MNRWGSLRDISKTMKFEWLETPYGLKGLIKSLIEDKDREIVI